MRGRRNELAEVLGEVVEVLAEPDGVRRVRGSPRLRRRSPAPSASRPARPRGRSSCAARLLVPASSAPARALRTARASADAIAVDMGEPGDRVRGETQPQRAADQAPQLLLAMCLVPCSASSPRSASSSRRPAVTARIAPSGAARRAGPTPTRPPGSDTRRPSGTRRRGRRRPRTPRRGARTGSRRRR